MTKSVTSSDGKKTNVAVEREWGKEEGQSSSRKKLSLTSEPKQDKVEAIEARKMSLSVQGERARRENERKNRGRLGRHLSAVRSRVWKCEDREEKVLQRNKDERAVEKVSLL